MSTQESDYTISMNDRGERPRVAVNVFVIRNNKLLLGKRKGRSDGYWGLPGGHLEWQETLMHGAQRELEEETGIRTDDLRFLHIVADSTPEDNAHYIHINFVAEKTIGEPELKEPDKCYEWRWFDIQQLPPSEEIFIGHRRCIPAFLEKRVFTD